MRRVNRAAWLFIAVSAVSFSAALIPVLKADGPNVVLLLCGIVFLIIAIASAGKSAS